MPIYEYKCRKKGHVFEVLLMASEKPPKKCTKCDSPVERLMSKASFQLKGSGWYATDYAPKAEGKDSKKAVKDGADEKPATPAKAEKPENKVTTKPKEA